MGVYSIERNGMVCTDFPVWTTVAESTSAKDRLPLVFPQRHQRVSNCFNPFTGSISIIASRKTRRPPIDGGSH